MSSSLDSAQIKQWGFDLGFDVIGVTFALPIDKPHTNALHDYLAKGYQGDMHYLARNVEKRLDVRQLVPGARSVICTALNYYHETPEQQSAKPYGKIARYAWGRDYHDVIKTKLHQLADRIKAAAIDIIQTRCFVDTAPLLEKAYAARAGLGWIGKNTLLLNERFGSWLVLGEIVTDLELDYDQPVPDQCGSCEKCLHSCPTNALVEPHILDARRCISYLTIESKLQVPTELQPKMGNWFFGCDDCQNVCPFNQKKASCEEPDFKPINVQRSLGNILSSTPEQLQQQFTGTSLSRTNYEQSKRIAMICKCNG
jgi:epoxyqueuosine reductase